MPFQTNVVKHHPNGPDVVGQGRLQLNSRCNVLPSHKTHAWQLLVLRKSVFMSTRCCNGLNHPRIDITWGSSKSRMKKRLHPFQQSTDTGLGMQGESMYVLHWNGVRSVLHCVLVDCYNIPQKTAKSMTTNWPKTYWRQNHFSLTLLEKHWSHHMTRSRLQCLCGNAAPTCTRKLTDAESGFYGT